MCRVICFYLQNLTCALHKRLTGDGIKVITSHSLPSPYFLSLTQVHTLGVDLDPLLVQRAVEANAALHPKLSFAPLDFLGPEKEVEQVIQGFLEQHGRTEFDLICVFRWVSKMSSLN